MAFTHSVAVFTPRATARLRTTRGQRAALVHRQSARMSAGAVVGLEAKWKEFAANMKKTNETPEVSIWNELLDECLTAGEPASKAIWVLTTMRMTGRTPTAASYERVLRLCALKEDRAAAFHLVELMWQDNVLLGDVDLPDGMDETLRNILPPEAFD